MVTQAEHHGGSRYRQTGSNITLEFGSGLLQQVEPTTAGLTVSLPPKAALKLGCRFVVTNEGTDSFDIDDGDDASSVATLATGELALLALVERPSTGARAWRARVKAFGAIANAGPAEVFYAIGGRNDETSVLEFDQQAGSWTTRTDAPNEHRVAAGFVVGAVGIVVGDDDVANEEKVDSYNPDVWTAKTDSGFRVENALGESATGAGYVIGGLGDADKCQEYNVGGDSWTARTDRPTDVFDGTAETYEDDVYTFNGTESSGADSNATEVFDAAANSWSAKMPQVAQVRRQGSFLADSRIYVLCGQLTAGNGVDDVQEYNPVGDSWVARLDFTGGARAFPGCADVEGTGYLFGGTDPAVLDDAYAYNAAADSWAAVADAPEAKAAHVETCLNISPP